MTIIELLDKYDGIMGAILGAVLGTVATLITTYLLKFTGKVHVQAINHKMTFFDTTGGSITERDVFHEGVRFASLDIALDLFNSSEVQVGLRDITLEYKIASLSSNTPLRHKVGANYEPLRVINLPSREMKNIEVRAKIDYELMKRISNGATVSLVAKDHKGKEIKEKLYDIERFNLPQQDLSSVNRTAGGV